MKKFLCMVWMERTPMLEHEWSKKHWSLQNGTLLLTSGIGMVRRAYVDIGSIDVVRVRDSFLGLQHHPVEVIWGLRIKDFSSIFILGRTLSSTTQLKSFEWGVTQKLRWESDIWTNFCVKLTWNDSGILVLLNVGLFSAVPQGVGVVLLHRIVELHLVANLSNFRGVLSSKLDTDRAVMQRSNLT